MKAVVWTDYGVTQVRDVAKPVAGRNEVLVRVRAACFCKTDIGMIGHGILGIEPPVIVGHEVSGVVEELGPGVEGLVPGQLVALDPPVPCRRCFLCRQGLTHMCPNTLHIGAHTPGGMAEYITIDYRNAHPVPPGLSAEGAALAEPFAVCLEAISQAGGVKGKTVCVFGDGPFGIIACRMARRGGAGKVLLFGHHEARMALARDYGVLTFDGRRENVGDRIREHSDGYGAQVIIDTTGAPEVLRGAMDWLMGRGVVVVFTPPAQDVPLDLEKVHFKEITIVGSCRSLNLFPEALRAMAEDAARTEALITHRLPIEEAQRGFELITRSKEQVVKAAIVFDNAAS
jgi:threonine dehydrogenase-like Zn-dependent dehydrogenase